MTEEEAQAWVAERATAGQVERLTAFAAMVVDENSQQNLVAPSTIATLWTRHIVDSAQLLTMAPPTGRWIDIGTGGGFPGMVVAILRDDPVLMVEPRRRRADFLTACVDRLALPNAQIVAAKIESVTQPAAIVSARAVATIENLLQAASSCATVTTRWLLPRGRFSAEDLKAARQRWQFVFHVEHSVTDPGSSILIMEQVQPR